MPLLEASSSEAEPHLKDFGTVDSAVLCLGDGLLVHPRP